MTLAALTSKGPEAFAHGTQARYVAGCRCEDCRAARRNGARERARKVKEASADVQPNPGPPTFKTFERRSRWGGVTMVRALMCPGTGGNPCVAGSAWLKAGRKVCPRCVDRAAVWNGLVPADRARKHLRKLQRQGVGYHAVHAVTDLGASYIARVRLGNVTQIRAGTERKLLAVTKDALADGAQISGAETLKLIEQLRARGFAGHYLARQLGWNKHSVNLLRARLRGPGPGLVTARLALKIKKLHKRLANVEPPPWKGLVPAAEAQQKVRELVDEGFTMAQLEKRLGFHLQGSVLTRKQWKQTTVAKVEAVYRQAMAELDDARTRFAPAERKRMLDEFAEARNG